MSKTAIKLQITFTAATAAVYSALAFLIHSQGSLSNIISLYNIPALTMIELFKFIFIKQTYGVQGQSVVSSKIANFSVLGESLKFAGIQLGGILLFVFICTVMGASPLSQFDGTLVLSSLLTTLTILPFSLFLGTRATTMLLFTNKLEMLTGIDDVYLRLLENSAVGVILGAWAGSVVMPLDWDRSWQVYPIPNIVGAAVGHVLGCVFSIFRTIFVDVKRELSKKIAL